MFFDPILLNLMAVIHPPGKHGYLQTTHFSREKRPKLDLTGL